MPVQNRLDFQSPPSDAVRAARVAFGMTQPQFAALLRSSARSVQEWEGGRRNMHPGIWRLIEVEAASRGLTLETDAAAVSAAATPVERVAGLSVVG